MKSCIKYRCFIFISYDVTLLEIPKWNTLLEVAKASPKMKDFILLFSKVSCHLKYFEIKNETNSIMHGFIMEFHNVKIYFVSLVGYAMKWNLLYTKFHLDETTLLSFFINFMPCHQNFLCGNSFNENETPIRSSLIVASL